METTKGPELWNPTWEQVEVGMLVEVSEHPTHRQPFVHHPFPGVNCTPATYRAWCRKVRATPKLTGVVMDKDDVGPRDRLIRVRLKVGTIHEREEWMGHDRTLVCWHIWDTDGNPAAEALMRAFNNRAHDAARKAAEL